MKVLRDFLPPPGNPMRPAQIVVLTFFAANLIGWNIAMPRLGSSTGSTIFLTIVIAFIAVICCGFVWLHGEAIENQRSQLLSGTVWARWQLSPAEYELYVRSSNREYGKLAVWLGTLGIVLGLGILVVTADLLLGGIMGGVFLFAAAFATWAGRVPRWFGATSTGPVDVLIGPTAAMVGNRLSPYGSSGGRILHVKLEYAMGELPSIVIQRKVGRGRSTTYGEFRVPVPADHVEEAQAIVERLSPDTSATGAHDRPHVVRARHEYSVEDIGPWMGRGPSAKRRTDASDRLGRWIR